MSLAAVYDQVGDPDVLRLIEVPDPVPGQHEVLVRVHAAGLNPFDAKARTGFISLDAPFPRRIGSDLAGTVEAVGADARYWDGSPIAVGDEVLGRGAGAVAERTIAHASGLARRPASLPVEVAGGLNIAGLTAVSCLATVPVGEGDTVLVGGASGAVGLVAAQLARDAGATVIGTASARRLDFVRSLGVEAVEYGSGMSERIAALGDVTAVFDCHGREALDAGLELGVDPGRMVAIAAYGALEETGAHNVERAARTPENLARLAQDIVEGSLIFPIAATFPLDQVVEAFTALEMSHEPGKIVVTP